MLDRYLEAAVGPSDARLKIGPMVGYAVMLCGAVVLCVGSAMQAVTELREYREFRDAVEESKVPDPRWELPELAFVVSHVAPWVTLIALPIEIFDWWKRLFKALTAVSKRARGGDVQAVRIHAGLARARNWCVVVLGAMLVVVASALELWRV
jgi:hypothetical protein